MVAFVDYWRDDYNNMMNNFAMIKSLQSLSQHYLDESKHDILLDVVDVTSLGAEDLMEKLNIVWEDCWKWPVVLVMRHGDGLKVKGPTAYYLIIDWLVDLEVINR